MRYCIVNRKQEKREEIPTDQLRGLIEESYPEEDTKVLESLVLEALLQDISEIEE